jgi:hypothetical protein
LGISYGKKPQRQFARNEHFSPLWGGKKFTTMVSGWPDFNLLKILRFEFSVDYQHFKEL